MGGVKVDLRLKLHHANTDLKTDQRSFHTE